VTLRWKCDSFAANNQIPCPLRSAKFIVVCRPGLKLYRIMNVRNLVHALTPHYTKLYRTMNVRNLVHALTSNYTKLYRTMNVRNLVHALTSHYTKLYRTMNVRNLVHALTPHYTKLYVSCQSHFHSLKPGVDDACFRITWLQHEMSNRKQQR